MLRGTVVAATVQLKLALVPPQHRTGGASLLPPALTATTKKAHGGDMVLLAARQPLTAFRSLPPGTRLV
jgi:hypothetical protein